MLNLAYKLGASRAVEEFQQEDSPIISSLSKEIEGLRTPVNYGDQEDSDTRDRVAGDVTSPVSWSSKSTIQTSRGS